MIQLRHLHRSQPPSIQPLTCAVKDISAIHKSLIKIFGVTYDMQVEFEDRYRYRLAVQNVYYA